MADKDIKILELEEINQTTGEDFYIVQTYDRTYKIKAKNLALSLGKSIQSPNFLGEQIKSFIPINDDYLLPMTGNEYKANDYPEFWEAINKLNDEDKKRFSIDNIADTFKLQNLTGYYGEASNIPNSNIENDEIKSFSLTSEQVQPTTQAHTHTVENTIKGVPSNGVAIAGDGKAGLYGTTTSSSETVVINPFTVKSNYSGGSETHPKRYFIYMYIRVKTVKSILDDMQNQIYKLESKINKGILL